MLKRFIQIFLSVIVFFSFILSAKAVEEWRFEKTKSCMPTLTWNEIKPGLSYDVVVFSALDQDPYLANRWERVFMVKGTPHNTVTIQPALEPKKRYFWSVRTRDADGRVGDWVSVENNILVSGHLGRYFKYWHGLETPHKCKGKPGKVSNQYSAK